MSEFDFNFSNVNEKYNIPLTKDLVQVLRTQSRIVLVPFFRKIAIQTVTTDNGHEVPGLTRLAENIIEATFDEGQLDIESEKRAQVIALAFISTLKSWQKAALSFYFCSDSSCIEEIVEEIEDFDGLSDEETNPAIGKILQQKYTALMSNDENLADYLVKELIHLQDIFSTEDIRSWDASSITSANENFESYAGRGQVLIPLTVDEYEYWEKIFYGEEENEDE